MATFIVVAAKLQRNWAKTSGRSISRGLTAELCGIRSTALAILSLLAIDEIGQ
jgi:hypothetical protein